VIICAAVKIQVEGLDHVTILPCIRHSDCFKILEDLGYYPKKGYKVLEQGFLTHNNIFLTRREAMHHARSVGQLPAIVCRHCGDELYSEDLY
jgi:hypothetical protein